METIAATRKFSDIYNSLNLHTAKPERVFKNAQDLNILVIAASGDDFEVLKKHLKPIQRYNIKIARADNFANAAKFLKSNNVELVLVGHSPDVYNGENALEIYEETKNTIPLLFISDGPPIGSTDVDSVNYVDLYDLSPVLLELVIRNTLHIFKLEQKLDDTTARLNEVKRAKDNFFAHVSHDLKTPLNAILGYSEALMLGAFGPLENNNVTDTLSVINRAGTNLLGAVNDLIARVSSADYMEKSVWETTDLNEIIRSAISQVEVFADCKKQKIVADFDAALCITECDKNAVKQAITSALTNAIKFSPELGNITVSTQNCGKQVGITICDRGIGMMASIVELTHAHCGSLEKPADTANEALGGTSLSIVRTVVDLHKGNLEISSNAGGGTITKITLPRRRSKTAM